MLLENWRVLHHQTGDDDAHQVSACGLLAGLQLLGDELIGDQLVGLVQLQELLDLLDGLVDALNLLLGQLVALGLVEERANGLESH